VSQGEPRSGSDSTDGNATSHSSSALYFAKALMRRIAKPRTSPYDACLQNAPIHQEKSASTLTENLSASSILACFNGPYACEGRLFFGDLLDLISPCRSIPRYLSCTVQTNLMSKVICPFCQRHAQCILANSDCTYIEAMWEESFELVNNS
jgi:hypothetical protein